MPNTPPEEVELDEILFFQSEPMSSNMLADWQIKQAKKALLRWREAYAEKARLKDWEEYWKFWIDPLNDDMECEQYIKDRISALRKVNEGE